MDTLTKVAEHIFVLVFGIIHILFGLVFLLFFMALLASCVGLI